MFERTRMCKSFSCWCVTNDDVYNHTELRCDRASHPNKKSHHVTSQKTSHHVTSQQSVTASRVHSIKLSIFQIKSFPEKRKPSSKKCFQIKCWRVHPATKCFIKVSFQWCQILNWNKTHYRTNPLIDFKVCFSSVCLRNNFFNEIPF